MKNSLQLLFIMNLFLVFPMTSCKKLIEIQAPVTNYTSSNVFSSDATAISVLTGMYAKFGSSWGGSFATGGKSISLLAGLSSDEFNLYDGVFNNTLIAYYKNALIANSSTPSGSNTGVS